MRPATRGCSVSEPESPATSSPRFVLYDFDVDQLVTTRLFDTYDEAADAADQLDDILIVPIVILTSGTAASEPEEAADQSCDCELPGFFNCSIPGILAHFENGRLAPGATVERCDQCERYATDEAARQRLVDLGLG